jgi:hypothetical protein
VNIQAAKFNAKIDALAAYFADMHTAWVPGSDIIEKVSPHYARALQDEPLIRRFKLSDNSKLSDNLNRWTEAYRSDGKDGKAGELEGRADGLWKE